MARVTVLMPTYNVAPYVKEAIESVLRQSYVDFELLVIDDCSTDSTLDVVRGIDDPRIRIVQNERNLGLADNLNRGLSLINTELVARMDGDDIAEPHWLKSEVDYLDAHPDVGICGGGFERFGTLSTVVRMPEKPEEIKVTMLMQCSIIVPTFRMSLYQDHCQRYRSDAFPAEDYRFWADCLRVTKAYNIQDTLFHYRMHPSQICSSMVTKQKEKVNEVRHYMLDLFGERLTDEDRNYFIGTIIDGEIKERADLRQRYDYIEKLVQINRDKQSFDGKTLRRVLRNHVKVDLYNTVIDKFFSKGYSLRAYGRYLSSGLALKTLPRLEFKIFAKSLLNRP
jgi:glycosyltransferase involved in cell wall biosynthesis